MSNAILALKHLTEEDVYDLYAGKFIFQYGEAEAVGVNNAVANSGKTEEYLNKIVRSNLNPDVDQVLSIVSGIGWLSLAKSEKVCYAAFVLVNFWKSMCEMNHLYHDPEHYKKALLMIAFKCSRMKFIKGNTLFEEYFKALTEYAQLNQAKNMVDSFYQRVSATDKKKVHEPKIYVHSVFPVGMGEVITVGNETYEVFYAKIIDEKLFINGNSIVFGFFYNKDHVELLQLEDHFLDDSPYYFLPNPISVYDDSGKAYYYYKFSRD